MKSSSEVSNLIHLALNGLQRMYDPEKALFVYALKNGQAIQGLSVRYSLICLIGLVRAQQAGYDVGFDLSRIFKQATQISEPDVSDLGLLLWAGACVGDTETLPMLYNNLTEKLDSSAQGHLLGMDLGVALSGLVAYAKLSEDEIVYEKARWLANFVIENCIHPESHLFYHTAGQTLRRTLPNFATQIYLMYGLIHYAQLTQDDRVAQIPTLCIEALCRLQCEDGGWPWVYLASGKVIEAYEIYSVHQDAMMPMVLQSVSETQGQSYRDVLQKSLGWIQGNNDLKKNMIVQDDDVVLRSIRRAKPWNNIVGNLNAVGGLTLKNSIWKKTPLEVDETCRSYHLGWILEAWCGREELR